MVERGISVSLAIGALERWRGSAPLLLGPEQGQAARAALAALRVIPRQREAGFGEHRGGLFGDARAFEEAGVLRAPQPHRIGEGEVAEIIRGDVAVFDQLVRLGQRMAHVDHVEMPDVGAEDRIELGPERVVAAERGGIHPVVRLAAEIIGLGVELDPVFLAGDLAGREIVDVLDVAGQIGLLGVGQTAALAQGRGDVVITVFLDEAHQFGAVELVGMHALQCLGAAPLPMRDQIVAGVSRSLRRLK